MIPQKSIREPKGQNRSTKLMISILQAKSIRTSPPLHV